MDFFLTHSRSVSLEIGEGIVIIYKQMYVVTLYQIVLWSIKFYNILLGL